MAKHLHIVSFDVPYPADYGGVMDVFCKVKALHEIGIAVHLHCFEYGKGEQKELEKYCEEVHYYQRKEGHKGFSLQLPYIVASRNDESLWQRLNADQHPVLFEGVHCTYGLTSGAVKKKNIAIRLHNVEHEYYHQLGKWETSIVRKAYMHHESRLLKRYEEKLKDYIILAISEDDAKAYKKQFKANQIIHFPAFVPNTLVTSKEGKGNFVLYHGNLSVAENEKAAIWLLQNVFTKIRKPFVIAGKKPSKRLQKLAALCEHASLIANPIESELNDLIRKAHINVLPYFNKNVTGIRLKLLHALFEGRHCVVNEPMTRGTGLEAACHTGTTANAFASIIEQLYHQPFTQEEILLRKKLLGDNYDNEKNTRQLIQYLY